MVVVLLAVAPEHGLGVGERRKVMLREILSPHAGVEGLDRRVVGRFPGPAEVERDAVRVGPLIEPARAELRPVVWIVVGSPRVLATRVRICATSRPLKCPATSNATHSRMYASTGVKTRMRCPVANPSLMKSIVQRSFGRVAAGGACRRTALRRRFGRFRRNTKPS